MGKGCIQKPASWFLKRFSLNKECVGLQTWVRRSLKSVDMREHYERSYAYFRILGGKQGGSTQKKPFYGA